MVADPTNRPRGEALRNKVLDTALALFSEQGYFNTSIHDIRKAAGVSIGAIYHHFQNKELLAKSLYDSLIEQVESEISAACAGRDGCRPQCDAIVARLFELTEQQPRMMQFVLLAQHREYLPDEPPICSSTPFQHMREVVVQGIAAGEVRDLEPWVAATAMFGGALRMMNLALDGVLDEPLSSYRKAVVKCGWRAIKR